jgi:NADP-dependent 3-hydroxy acid dehydrogenase YdfG
MVGLYDALGGELGGKGLRFSVIEPGAVWAECGHNTLEGVMEERGKSVDTLRPEECRFRPRLRLLQPLRVLIEEILVRPVKQIAP